MDYNTTGDGQLSAVQLTKIMQETGKSLSQLASEVTIYPKGWRSQRDDGSVFYGVTLRGFEVSTMAPTAPTATPARHG